MSEHDTEHAANCPVCQLEATPESLVEVEATDFYVLDYEGTVHVVRGVVAARADEVVLEFHHHTGENTCHTTVFVLEGIVKWSTEPIDVF